MHRFSRRLLFLAIPLSLMVISAAGARGRQAGGFWADSTDDFYHRSGCTQSRKPPASRLVTGTERHMIRLGYYPHPFCLPNRLAAHNAGRIVRVELGDSAIIRNDFQTPAPSTTGPAAFPADPNAFPSLAPGSDASKPSTFGGFPIAPSQTGRPAGSGSSEKAGSSTPAIERRQGTGGTNSGGNPPRNRSGKKK